MAKASNRISFRERISAVLGRKPGIQIFSAADLMVGGSPKGHFTVRHGRGGRIINEYFIPNLITNEGKNHILDVQFHGTSPISPWYLGLIDNASFTAVAAADNYDQINGTNGWDEFVDYTDRNNSDSAVTRPTWVEGAAASQSITTNSTLAIYDFTDAGTLKGLFVAGGASAATKGDNTSGTGHKLWAATPFADLIEVAGGDDLSVSYTVSWPA